MCYSCIVFKKGLTRLDCLAFFLPFISESKMSIPTTMSIHLHRLHISNTFFCSLSYLCACHGWVEQKMQCNLRKAQSESICPVRSASVYLPTTTVAFVIVVGSLLHCAGRCGSAKGKGQLWRYNTGSICGSLREPPPAAIICYNPTAATKPNTWRAVNRICGPSIVTF